MNTTTLVMTAEKIPIIVDTVAKINIIFYGYGLDFWFYDTGDEDSAWFPLASGNSYEVIEFKYIEFDRNNREITFYFYNGNDMYWSF